MKKILFFLAIAVIFLGVLFSAPHNSFAAAGAWSLQIKSLDGTELYH